MNAGTLNQCKDMNANGKADSVGVEKLISLEKDMDLCEGLLSEDV